MSRTAAFLLLLLISATLALADGVTIKKVELARDRDGSPSQVVNALKPGDNPFHVIVSVKPLDHQTTISGTLVAVDAGNTKNYKVASVDLSLSKGFDQATFKFKLPRPWPEGKYRVEIRVDGRVVKNLNFSIKA